MAQPKRKFDMLSQVNTKQAVPMEGQAIQGLPYRLKRLKNDSPKPGGDEDHRVDFFPFLDLPGEVRNMVYAMLLVTPGIVHWTGYHIEDIYRPKGLKRRRTFSILSRSRYGQLRHGQLPGSSSADVSEGGHICHGQLRHGRVHHGLSILTINSQIHKEALPYLYCQPLGFGTSLDLTSFLIDIGPRNISLLAFITITSITFTPSPFDAVWLPDDPDFEWAGLLLDHPSTSLRTLHLPYLGQDFRECDADLQAECIYKYLRNLLERILLARGLDAAVELVHLDRSNFWHTSRGEMAYKESFRRLLMSRPIRLRVGDLRATSFLGWCPW